MNEKPVLDDSVVEIHHTYDVRGRISSTQMTWHGECKFLEDWVEYFKPHWHVTIIAIRNRIKVGYTTADKLFRKCKINKPKPDIETRNTKREQLVAREARAAMSIMRVPPSARRM